MARANRHYIPGSVWHITHRCHKKERGENMKAKKRDFPPIHPGEILLSEFLEPLVDSAPMSDEIVSPLLDITFDL